MPTTWTRARLGALVATGMVLFIAGVVAGSAVGTLIRPEPAEPQGRALLLGQSSRAGDDSTRLVANTTGGAFWIIQNGSGAAVRGEAPSGRGGVFVTGHRNANGLVGESEAESAGSGAAVAAIGNRNVGVRARSETVAVVAEGSSLGLYASGGSVITGDVTLRGACDGCLSTALAVNRTDAPLSRGDAVAVIGITIDEDGTMLLDVVKAASGGRAMGVVSEGVTRVSVPVDLESALARYEATDGPALPGGALRIVIGGIVEFASADASLGEIQAGDSLIVGPVPGVLVRAAQGTGVGHAVGYALGTVSDGGVALLISPH